MLARLRMLQLTSQVFPIGGYSHSQGLEAAIESGHVHDEATVQQWIADMLDYSGGSYELPALTAMHDAWLRRESHGVARLNEEFLASRESAELRSATVQMGYSMSALLKVLPDLPDWLTHATGAMVEPSLPCVWSGLAAAWCIPPADTAIAYLWTWAENQVLVAMKCVPIGQSAGQRILLAIGTRIAAHPAGRHSNFAPGLAILSSQHENQYSRLFRS